MNWRLHTECPDSAPETALIAILDEEAGGLFLSGLYSWNGDHFMSEETGDSPDSETFWWILEDDLLEGLPGFLQHNVEVS